MNTCVCVCAHACMFVRVHVCKNLCVCSGGGCVRMYLLVFECVCANVHASVRASVSALVVCACKQL